MGNEDPFRKALPKCTILSCVVSLSLNPRARLIEETWVGATQRTPGIVDHIKSEFTQIGLFPNPQIDSTKEQERLRVFVSLLEEGGTPFEVVDNVQVQRWEKVVWNVAWNSITTLTMVDTQMWLTSSSHAISTSRRLMTEVAEVGRKAGVPLEDGLVDRLMDKILGMPGLGSSMQVDAQNGRPLELDAILGVPVRKARELGVSIPTLETIYSLLVAVDRRLRNG